MVQDTTVLYMLVGVPGSGKTTLANQIPNSVVWSSDAIREELYDDVNNTTNHTTTFEVMHERIFNDLSKGINVVYDATNTHAYLRRKFLYSLRNRFTKVTTVCICMDTDIETCKRWNFLRDRKVPVEVIYRMHNKFDAPSMKEGWDAIVSSTVFKRFMGIC